MKSKLLKKTDVEQEVEQEELEDVEVEEGGPSIASVKRNKVTIIFASAVLITVVLYFFFFKSSGPDNTKQKLVPVDVPAVSSVAGGESPFAIDTPKESVKNQSEDILSAPVVPDVPSLPSLPESSISDNGNPIVPDVGPLPTDQNQNINGQNQNGQNQFQQNQQAQLNNQANQNVNNAVPDADPRYSPIVVFSGGGNVSAPGVGYDNNIIDLSENPIDDLKETPVNVKATHITDRIHAINQGKLLTAVLETAINTEVPGFVRAVISRDVYGESGNEVLIPKGSRLYGSYSSKISKGQGRVDINWTRLIRSDGVDLAISFNASDQFGRSGIAGDVDNRYGSIITNSLLTSILAVGGAVAAQNALGNSANTTATTTAGVTTTSGNAASQAVTEVTKTIVGVASQIVSDALNLSPVITVPQGTKITVVVNSDLNLPSMSRR
ncbi:MAG: TrbI/VirB10 family protein [Rickettsiales bacterium]|nr:TrbI/VirB10 family protein [Rickettsiales bacterium]